MSDKKYRLDLSLDQIELINELINFKINEEVAWNVEDYEEVMELSKYINQKLGYYEGQRNLDGVEEWVIRKIIITCDMMKSN